MSFSRCAKLGVAAWAGGLVIATAAGASDIIDKRTVGEDWFDFEIRWDEGAPTYHGKWMIFDQGGGVIMICGVGAHRGGRANTNAKIMKDRGIHIGEELLMADIRFFATVNRRNDVAGAQANCVSTGKNIRNYSSREVSIRPVGPHRRY